MKEGKKFMLLDSVIDDYLSFMKGVKHFSSATVEAYSYDLSVFASWLDETKADWKLVKDSDLRIFVSEMLYGGSQVASVNRMLSTIREFYKYALSKKYLKENPTLSIRNLHSSHKITSFLFPKEMKAFCELPQDRNMLWAARDVALFMSLYSTGCRVSELVAMNMEDFTSDLKVALIMGKGKKEREVFFTDFAISALRKYFVEREKLLKKINKLDCNEKATFLNLKGGRLTSDGVNYIIGRYNVFAEKRQTISAHSFRHSFATALIVAGADVRVVQELLGHKSISTTEQYTHVGGKRLLELYKKAHPHS